MIEIIKSNDEVINFLKQEGFSCHNALNYVAYDKNACVFIYNSDVSNGVIISNADQDFFYLVTKCRDFLDEFWSTLPIGHGHKLFSGVADDVAEVFLADKTAAWQSPCKVYAFFGDNFAFEENLEYAHDVLTANDAEEVDEFYTYRDEDSVHRLRDAIIESDSSCVRINNDLAAWCMVHTEDGSMGPLFTKEAYRRRGLGQLVSGRLIKKLLAKGHVPYVHINVENTASLALAADMAAFTYTHDCVWFGVMKE